MKPLFYFLLSGLLCYNVFCQTPSITMSTTQTVGTEFIFQLTGTTASTTVQVDFGDGFVNKTFGSSGTDTIKGVLASSTIKVKGTGIHTLDCSRTNLVSLDVTEYPALEYLVCRDNQLSVLDVTKNTALKILDCINNQLTTLDLTKNTALIDLKCYSNQLTSLDLTKNTQLKLLWAYDNQITSLDLSKNTALITAYLQDNMLNTIDLSQNINLQNFNCSNNPIISLDVTKNVQLIRLFCHENKLTTLDISKNSALEYFQCYKNQLTSLDVSNNTALKQIYCEYNKLTDLDVSQNTALTQFNCHHNNLSLASLPIKQAGWTSYSYNPQNPFPIPQSVHKGEEVDLSSQLTINGVTTDYKWYLKNNLALTAGTDYTVTNGKTVFLKTQIDSVFCGMTNSTFESYSSGNYLFNTSNLKILESVSGISEPQINDSKVFVDDFNILHVIAPYSASMSVFDMNGRLVLSGKVESGNNNVQLHKKGIYLVMLSGKGNIISRKIYVK